MANYAGCIARIAQAAGRKLSDDEVSAIFGRVHRAALDIKAGRASPADVTAGKKIDQLAGMSSDALIRAAAERASAELIHEAAVAEKQAYLQVVKLGARAADVERMVASGQAHLDAVKNTIARDYSGRTPVESLEQRVAGHKGYFERKLLDTWEALGSDFLGFFQDRTKLLNLVRELRGEKTGDALAAKGAKAFHDVAEEARQTFNGGGGDIGRLDDWGMPQHHSQEKVASAGGSKDPVVNREAWVNDMLPIVKKTQAQGRYYVDDAGQAWSEARLREFLENAWQTIATDGHGNTQPGAKGVGKTANRHAESRQLHFPDAESVINYWEKYGERTVVEILHGHVDTMARDIAFIEHFGPNPNTTYQTLRDAALRAATNADPRKTQELEGRAAKLDILWDYAAGRTKPSANRTFSAIADGIAHLNVAGKLGGAVLASLFGDKPMMEAVSHMNNLQAVQRWRTELSLLNPTNTADRALLQQQGLMLDSVRSGLQRFYEGLGQSSATGRVANAVMRITGMQAINDIRKGAFGASLMAAIGKQLEDGVAFGQLADSDVRALQNYGITENDWRVWQLAKPDNLAGNKALTPEAISRIPDADVGRAVSGDVQKVQKRLGDQIAELMWRNAKEAERLDALIQGIQKAESAAAKRLAAYMTSKDVAVQKAAALIEARQELLKARLERFEAESDIEAYVMQQRSRNEATDLAVAAMLGKNVERALETSDRQGDRASRQRGWIGERLGEKRGRTERRVIEMDEQVRRLEREASAEVKAKYDELRGVVQSRIDEADAWYAESEKRIERRGFVIDRLLKEASGAEKTVVTEARRNAIVKLLGAVNTESEFAIVTPGWKERAAFYGDLQRGTAKGEIVRSILQFKSFPWALLQRGMDAIANQDKPASKAAMAAYLITSTTLAGAMLMQTREMLSGKDPLAMNDENWWKFWGKAFIQGGALGIYGDFLYGANQTRYGSGILETLAGPTVGPLLELGLVQPMNAAKKAIEGKDTHLLAQSVQDLKGFVPGGNIWYAKAALDHLIWQNVMESLSPGYLAAIRQRTAKDFNQQWWWSPGETSPERAPDLGAAVR